MVGWRGATGDKDAFHPLCHPPPAQRSCRRTGAKLLLLHHYYSVGHTVEPERRNDGASARRPQNTPPGRQHERNHDDNTPPTTANHSNWIIPGIWYEYNECLHELVQCLMPINRDDGDDGQYFLVKIEMDMDGLFENWKWNKQGIRSFYSTLYYIVVEGHLSAVCNVCWCVLLFEIPWVSNANSNSLARTCKFSGGALVYKRQEGIYHQ